MNNARDFKGYDGVFAKRLRKKMDASKTTQETLAKQTGLTRQTISQYMDGSVLPNAEKLYKMCEYFNIPCDYLLGRTDSQSKDISDQYIQDTTGLSTGAIQYLVGTHQGHSNELFPIPYNMDAINYILSNPDFMRTFIKRLFTCWYEKSENEKATELAGQPVIREESATAKYLLLDLISEHLIDKGYEDFYKPVVLSRYSKPKLKPGRKRKENVGEELEGGALDGDN